MHVSIRTYVCVYTLCICIYVFTYMYCSFSCTCFSSHAVVTGGVDRIGEFKAKATWPVWSAQIFHKLNAFMERCNDLHEVTSTVIHFQ